MSKFFKISLAIVAAAFLSVTAFAQSTIEEVIVTAQRTEQSLQDVPIAVSAFTEDMLEELQKKLNSALFPGSQGGPLMHVIAAKAVCFKEAMEEDFISYQKQILLNAKAMSKRFMSNDIDIVSNGTSNHMFLVNLIKNDVTGKILEAALGEAFITVNKNSVPNDPKSPFVTSGIRIGTPAVTRRGFQEKEVSEIADWISKIIKNVEDKNLISEIKEQVKTLCGNFPVYSQ